MQMKHKTIPTMRITWHHDRWLQAMLLVPVVSAAAVIFLRVRIYGHRLVVGRNWRRVRGRGLLSPSVDTNASEISRL